MKYWGHISPLDKKLLNDWYNEPVARPARIEYEYEVVGSSLQMTINKNEYQTRNYEYKRQKTEFRIIYKRGGEKWDVLRRVVDLFLS